MAGAVAARVESIKDKAGIKNREVAELLSTTPQTVSRWKTGKTEPQRSTLEKLLELEWLIKQLGEVYEPDEARLWLYSRHPLLGGRSPAVLIQEGRTDEVLKVISQLKEGAYI